MASLSTRCKKCGSTEPPKLRYYKRGELITKGSRIVDDITIYVMERDDYKSDLVIHEFLLNECVTCGYKIAKPTFS
jgi:predicted nucleic-acid-binding Zn-ribbon protein